MCSLWNGPAKDPKSKEHSRRMFCVVLQRSRKIKVPPCAALPISQLLQAQGQVDGGSSKRRQVFTKGHRPENGSHFFPTLRLLEVQAFVTSSISWTFGLYVMKWSWKRSCVRARKLCVKDFLTFWPSSTWSFPRRTSKVIGDWESLIEAEYLLVWRLGIRLSTCMLCMLYTLIHAFR